MSADKKPDGSIPTMQIDLGEVEFTPMKRAATTVYPTRFGAFPAASFFTREAEFSYIRTVQTECHGTFGICVCPAESFWLHQVDVRPVEDASGR